MSIHATFLYVHAVLFLMLALTIDNPAAVVCGLVAIAVSAAYDHIVVALTGEAP